MAQGVKFEITKEQLEKDLETMIPKQIAIKYNVSTTTIRRNIKKFNLSINQDVLRQAISESRTQYRYNSKYFNKIDTLEKAYLLGFISADGFITDRNELGIEVGEKDKEVVYFFKKQLETEKEPYFCEQTNSVGLRINSVEIKNDLEKLGLMPRKSLTLDIKEVIEKADLNEQQIKAFLLGYFDGDGCISKGMYNNRVCFQMNITGTKETLDYYYNYFDKHGTWTKRHKDDKNNYTLAMSNNYSTIYNALSKFYSIASELDFCYQRKLKLFKELEDKVLSSREARLKGIELYCSEVCNQR